MSSVQNRFFFDIDFKRRLLLFCEGNVVADFAFEADIGDETVAGFGVDARKVSCIGISVWIAVFDVEQ